jgi:hypothetical protein
MGKGAKHALMPLTRSELSAGNGDEILDAAEVVGKHGDEILDAERLPAVRGRGRGSGRSCRQGTGTRPRKRDRKRLPRARGTKIIRNAEDINYGQSSLDKAFSKHSTDFGSYPDGSNATKTCLKK